MEACCPLPKTLIPYLRPKSVVFSVPVDDLVANAEQKLFVKDITSSPLLLTDIPNSRLKYKIHTLFNTKKAVPVGAEHTYVAHIRV